MSETLVTQLKLSGTENSLKDVLSYLEVAYVFLNDSGCKHVEEDKVIRYVIVMPKTPVKRKYSKLVEVPQ